MKELTTEERKFIVGSKGKYYKKIKDKDHLTNALRLLIKKQKDAFPSEVTSIASPAKLKKFIDFVYTNGLSAFAMDICVRDVALFLHKDNLDSTLDLLKRGIDFYNTEIMLVDTVYHTSDYSRFKLARINRSINLTHVNKLARSIKAEGQAQPILVDSSFIVLDGQHRLAACKLLGINVNYMLSKKKTSQKRIITVNNIAKSWSSADYLESYVAAGKKEYKKIKKYMQTYGTSLSITMRVMGITPKELRSGDITLNITEEMKNDFIILKRYADKYPAFKNRRFVTEVLRYFKHEAFDSAKFDRQLAKYPTWLSTSYKDLPEVRKDIRRIMTFRTKASIVKVFNKVEFDLMNG